MSSLLSKHWSCIYWDSSAWIDLHRIESAKYHTLLSFLHFIIFLLDFNVGNRLIMCEMKEPSKKRKNDPSSLTKVKIPTYKY